MEIEHIDAKALENVMRDLNVDVEPIPATLRLIQVGVPLHAGEPQPRSPTICQHTCSVLLQPQMCICHVLPAGMWRQVLYCASALTLAGTPSGFLQDKF